jgi:hypothetical protein
MNELIIIKSVFIFMCLWGISLVFLWFRPRIEIIWKALATVIFGLYVWFFFSEIHQGLAGFTASWYITLVDFFKELLTLVFVNLFLFWPVALMVIFYKADDIGAEKLLRFMCVFTLVLWILFVIYSYFSSGIDAFFYEKLREMVPFAK